MRKQATFRKLVLLSLFIFSQLLFAKDFIGSGKKRYIGMLKKSDGAHVLVLNHQAGSPFEIRIDIDKFDGLNSFVGNYVDLDLLFKNACSENTTCKAKVIKYNGIHPATKKVPSYIL